LKSKDIDASKDDSSYSTNKNGTTQEPTGPSTHLGDQSSNTVLEQLTHHGDSASDRKIEDATIDIDTSESRGTEVQTIPKQKVHTSS
jgi:hypothetical protein